MFGDKKSILMLISVITDTERMTKLYSQVAMYSLENKLDITSQKMSSEEEFSDFACDSLKNYQYKFFFGQVFQVVAKFIVFFLFSFSFAFGLPQLHMFLDGSVDSDAIVDYENIEAMKNFFKFNKKEEN